MIQKAYVKWSATQTASYSFGILNGTRQGSSLSPILFTVYMDGLLVKLRKSGFGCYIGDLFLGVVAYCDDFLLLSPTRNGLQNLLKSLQSSIIFPFQQIQIHLNPSPNVFILLVDRKPLEVVLNHQKLPWVSQVDCRIARCAYIGSSTEFSISARHCKSYLLGKLIVVPFMEATFGTFLASLPVKPTDLGTQQLKFAGTYHSLHTHIL